MGTQKELEERCEKLEKELYELRYRYEELTKILRKEGKDKANGAYWN